MAKKLVDKGLFIIPPEYKVGDNINQVLDSSIFSKLNEAFKQRVKDNEITFPKDLGAEHPFDFELVENTIYSYGVLNAILDKTANEVVSDFTVELKNNNSQALVNQLLDQNNIHTLMKEWVKEALGKGNGYIEIDLNEGRLKTINANSMYVKRDKNGKVEKFNQFLGNLKNFKIGKSEVIEFKPNQIAHLKIDAIPGSAYGLGIIYPNMRTIDNIIGSEIDYHKLIKRKAGAPLHVKIGQPGEQVSQESVDGAKKDMQYLTTRTEWASDGNVDIKAIDIPDLGKSLMDTINHDYRMLLGGTQTPEVLMGSGQLNEGIAKVQLEGRKTYIKSLRAEIENIIEENIIRPFLNSQKINFKPNKGETGALDEQPIFKWDLQSEEEINKKIERLNTLIQNPLMSAPMRAAVELEISKLLGIEGLENVLIKPDKAKEEEDQRKEKEKENAEREEEENIPQPEVPGAKPNAKEKHVNTINCMHGEGCGNQIDIEESRAMTLHEWVNITEANILNYQDYIFKALEILKKYEFPYLKAITPQDIEDGLLNDLQIEKLRIILKNGYKENKTIREIEKEIKGLNLPDKLKDGVITAKAEIRPNSIARTETVRLSNLALLDIYKDNKIDKVRFLAALSDRTCPECSQLNGRVFNTKEAGDVIPVHTSCRCSFIPLLE
jgi:SPP1 gp7 family putative phage head morphogenesis protein